MNANTSQASRQTLQLKRCLWIVLLLGGCLITGQVAAEPKPGQRVNNATQALQKLVHIPENAIPPVLLRRAQGIAIFPNVLKFGFIFGGRHGTGLVAVRKPNGKWSKPALVSLTSGSFGFQAGASSSDIVLVFKSRKSVERLAGGQFNLGANASVAAGPVGRLTGASTNLTMKAEIYSYSRSRGLFAGVAIDGGRISIDQDANWLFYNKAGISADDILNDGDSLDNMSKPGERLVYTLNQYLPPANGREAAGSDMGSQSDSGQMDSDQTGSSIGSSKARKQDGGVSVQRQ